MKRNLAKLAAFVLAAAVCFGGLVWLKHRYSHWACPPNLGLRGLRAGGGTDLLLVGSSLTRSAYDLKQLEKLTGRRGYVLAYNGLDPAFMYPLLRQALADPGIRVDTVVVEATAGIACLPPALRDTNLFLHAPPAVKDAYLELLRAQPGGLPWREEYDLIVASKNADIMFHPIAGPLVGHTYYHGAFVSGPPGSVSPRKFLALKPMATERQPLNERQLAAMEAIFRLLRERGVRAIFVEPAEPAPVLAVPEVRENRARLRHLIEAAGFAFVDAGEGFPNDNPKNFLDGRHLSRVGRRLATERLAAILAPPDATKLLQERPTPNAERPTPK